MKLNAEQHAELFNRMRIVEAERAGMDPAELAAAFRAKAMDAMMDDDPKAVSAYAAAAAVLQDRAQKQQEIELKDRPPVKGAGLPGEKKFTYVQRIEVTALRAVAKASVRL